MFRGVVFLCLALIMAFPSLAHGTDVVRIFTPASASDPRGRFSHDLFIAILEATQSDFGLYEYEEIPSYKTRDREVMELVIGRTVNVAILPTRSEIEDQLDVIRIPIMKGLMGYRVLFVNRDSLGLFSTVHDLEQLKKLKMGLHAQWSITRALAPQGFRIVTGMDYDGLFGMLAHGRFDYFPRGINEVFDEYEVRKHQYAQMVVEPSIALHVHLPNFIFISPAHPGIGKRIRAGLGRIMQNGVYDKVFDKYFGQVLAKAKLEERTMFTVDNPLLSAETRQALKEYCCPLAP